jgi:predicted nucleotide-binding protein (sugar kinase/HSP70/actin superfamily)
MKIGLPRALLYFRYGWFWESYLKNLGLEVITSPPTNKTILERGLKYVSSEICLPVKILFGHLDWLKNRVSRVFLPRIIELNGTLYTCPKMIGMVDIARIHFNQNFSIIAPKIKNNFLWSHFLVGIKITKNLFKTKKALNQALRSLNHHRFQKLSGRPQILLLSHFYNLNDHFISQPIIKTITKHGFEILTKEDLDPKILNSSQGFARNIRWVYERELYNAFEFFLPQVAGVCNIISFGCGPDSLIGEIMLRRAQIRNVPFLQLVIDEHTSPTGLITRLEAFCEIIKNRYRTPSSSELIRN